MFFFFLFSYLYIINPFFFFFKGSGTPRHLPFSPTRRSSDLVAAPQVHVAVGGPRIDPAGLRRLDAVVGTERRDTGLRPGDARGRLAAGVLRGELELDVRRSEEHTSELQSRLHLVCRLLLANK